MKKVMMIILFLFLGTILEVHAEVYKFSEICGSNSYQCIACEYEATHVNKNQHIILYASSNGKGNIDVKYEAFSSVNGKRGISIVKWDLSSEYSKFINDTGDGLQCPEVFMKDDGAGNTEKISVHFGVNTETQSTLVGSEDNGGVFLEENVNYEDITCPNIPIYILGAGVVGTEGNFSTKNYRTTSDVGTIVKGENVELQLPAGYQAVSEWKNVDDSLIDDCDSNIIIACSEQTNQSYQTAYIVRTCYLRLKDDLSGRVEVDYDNKPIDSGNSSNSDSFTPAELCDNGECDISIDSFCDEAPVKQTFRFIGMSIVLLKILVPIILIGMGIVSLVQVILSGKEDEMKKKLVGIAK
ncbi:MAG: hypothetical protein IJ704_04930 [Bacilli bacterium]|nr:hypothetical protein [Bacilli bacterium]